MSISRRSVLKAGGGGSRCSTRLGINWFFCSEPRHGCLEKRMV